MLRSPARAALAIVFMLLVGWTLQSLFHTGLFTIAAVLLVWGQVASFFIPTTYTLTENGVKVKGLVNRREKDWSDFRTYLVDRNGVLLSPFVERTRLERFRGLSLQFHGNRDEVVAYVERILGGREGDELDVGDEGQEEGGGAPGGP